MTDLNKLADEYASEHERLHGAVHKKKPSMYGDAHLGFQAGFKKAREMAAEVIEWNAKTYEGNATGMVLKCLLDTVASLGESDAERDQQATDPEGNK